MARNPLNDSDVDGNTIAWMADSDRSSKDYEEQEHTCNQCGEVLTDKEVQNWGDICADCRENEIMGDEYGKI